jgi:hypothetical protein
MSYTPPLKNYRAIRSHLLIKITVPYYVLNPGDTPTSTVLTFSDLNLKNNLTYNGDTYLGMGGFLSVTASRSELAPTSNEVTIGLSGIPNSSIFQIVNSRIKGCSVEINRAIFDPTSGAVINVNQVTGDNVLARYRGYVNNYSLTETYDVRNKIASNTLLLICRTNVDFMGQKISGRLTNSVSQKKFFPNDLSMDRVTAIQNTYFDFGAPV